MAAQIDLGGRGEPAEIVAVTVAARHQERGLGKIVLGGDPLHNGVVEPFPERTDRRRIAGEHGIGEGVHLIDRDVLGGQPPPGNFRTVCR